VKCKHVYRQSAVVCGWREGDGGRSGQLGSLLLGVQSDDGLVYVGRVGTGFTAATLRQWKERLTGIGRDDAPLVAVPAEDARTAHWVDPIHVVEVEYTSWTSDSRLRHPSYKGLRDDLDVEDVVREP
jgi:bifunctional non-homologous end joining protein LigD